MSHGNVLIHDDVDEAMRGIERFKIFQINSFVLFL